MWARAAAANRLRSPTGTPLHSLCASRDVRLSCPSVASLSKDSLGLSRFGVTVDGRSTAIAMVSARQLWRLSDRFQRPTAVGCAGVVLAWAFSVIGGSVGDVRLRSRPLYKGRKTVHSGFGSKGRIQHRPGGGIGSGVDIVEGGRCTLECRDGIRKVRLQRVPEVLGHPDEGDEIADRSDRYQRGNEQQVVLEDGDGL